MEIRFVLAVSLAAVLVLVGLVLVYLRLYKGHINKQLRNPPEKPRKMLPPPALMPFLPLVLILVAVAAGVLDMEYDLSGSRRNTQEEILASARIGYEDFQSQLSISEDVAAVLSYPEDLSEAEFRVYINKNSNYPDYVFRRGGDLTAVERAAYLLEYNGTYILISLNAPRIAEVRCENGMTYSVDPDAPFVLVIPDGGFLLSEAKDNVITYSGYTGITVYDAQGNEIDLTQIQWFEMARIY